jgi:hypothetical protein
VRATVQEALSASACVCERKETGTAADPVIVVAGATAVCDSMHKARPGRGLRPFQLALLILGSRLAPTTIKVRGGPGHCSEKRINLSTADLILKPLYYAHSFGPLTRASKTPESSCEAVHKRASSRPRRGSCDSGRNDRIRSKL